MQISEKTCCEKNPNHCPSNETCISNIPTDPCNCEPRPFDYCDPDPCVAPGAKCSNGNMTYICTNCPDGWQDGKTGQPCQCGSGSSEFLPVTETWQSLYMQQRPPFLCLDYFKSNENYTIEFNLTTYTKGGSLDIYGFEDDKTWHKNL